MQHSHFLCTTRRRQSPGERGGEHTPSMSSLNMSMDRATPCRSSEGVYCKMVAAVDGETPSLTSLRFGNGFMLRCSSGKSDPGSTAIPLMLGCLKSSGYSGSALVPVFAPTFCMYEDMR